MSNKALRIGIAGGGIGGLSAAIALGQVGHDVTVLEQAKRFSHVGSDVNLTPNAVHAADGLGIGRAIRERGARPTFRISRDWQSGEVTSRLGMSDLAEQLYGAPQITIHRADIIDALAEQLPAGRVQFSRRVLEMRQDKHGVDLCLENGTIERFDVVIGADGIHSPVRTALFGEEHPRFTGLVSFRSVIPTERVEHVPEIEAFNKWWGPTSRSQIVSFPLDQGRQTFVFATTGQESWTEESWTSEGDVDELRGSYKEFHADARCLLDACDGTLKSALYEREPLPRWSLGAVTLLGDSCHPMLPFMAQGAGMALEDAVVIARAMTGVETRAEAERALCVYEMARRERTARIQLGSRGNKWMKAQDNADWVYGYDAWKTELGSP